MVIQLIVSQEKNQVNCPIHKIQDPTIDLLAQHIYSQNSSHHSVPDPELITIRIIPDARHTELSA
jgi:hypothetical protein